MLELSGRSTFVLWVRVFYITTIPVLVNNVSAPTPVATPPTVGAIEGSFTNNKFLVTRTEIPYARKTNDTRIPKLPKYLGLNATPRRFNPNTDSPPRIIPTTITGLCPATDDAGDFEYNDIPPTPAPINDNSIIA